MSAKATFWAWKLDIELTANQRLVLLRLADHANDEGIAWPGKESLSKACGVSKRTVDTAIEYLANLQLISVRKRDTDGGKSLSNVYVLNYEQGGLFGGTGVQLLQGCKSCTPANDAPPGVQILQGRGATVAPESTIEPTIEPTMLTSPDAEAPDEGRETYKTKKGKTLKGAALDRFNQFWPAFGYKVGKAEAADAWIELELSGTAERHFDLIMFAARRTHDARDQLVSKGGTPKMPEGWLRGRRFEDFIDEFKKSSPGQDAAKEKPAEWWQSWLGILDKAGNYGITKWTHDDGAPLLQALVDTLAERGEDIPDGLYQCFGHLLKQTDQVASGQ